MEQNKDEIVIDLREIFGILKHNVVKVLIVTLLFVLGAGAYIYVTPNKYESKAVVYVVSDEREHTVSSTIGGQFDELMKTPVVFEKSAACLLGKGINTSASQIAGQVRFERKRNSMFVNIVARDNSPERACAIAQAVAENGVKHVTTNIADRLNCEIAVYKTRIQNSMPSDMLSAVYADMVKLEGRKEALTSDIKIIENAVVNPIPVAPRKVRIMAVAFVLGIICGSMYAVLREKM